MDFLDPFLVHRFSEHDVAPKAVESTPVKPFSAKGRRVALVDILKGYHFLSMLFPTRPGDENGLLLLRNMVRN